VNVEPADKALIRDLSRLFDGELARAKQPPLPHPAASRLDSASLTGLSISVLVVAAGVAIGLLVVRGLVPLVPIGANASSSARTDGGEQSPSGSAAPDGQGTPGPLVNGVPGSFGGEIVLQGSDLAAWIAATKDDTPFLAGGWWHQGEVIRACPNPRSREVVSCIVFELYKDAEGGEKLWVAPGDDGLLPSDYGHLTRPVVLRLHTHDLRCSADDPGCQQRSVLLEVLWLGPPS
jgi:hypothetical protein